MTQVNDYKSPCKDKDTSMVNKWAYTFLNEYEDEKVIQIKRLRRAKSQSQILTFITHQLEPLLSIQPSQESESLDKGDVASPRA